MTSLHRFAAFVAACTFLLVIAGGLVTSTGSGLSVPDWPSTYGWFMFTFPVSKMVGGIVYEHGHRLLASTVGLLLIALVVWVWRSEPRRWVRMLALGALLAVVMQGVLGGITVLNLLPPPVSIAHAGLAEIVFCLTVSIALVTSRSWLRGYGPRWSEATLPGGSSARVRSVFSPVPAERRLRRLALGSVILIYAQILIGATMRHTGAGLAIPDFPLSFGRLVPPLALLATGPVAIHFAHRIGAVIVVAAVLVTAVHIRRHDPSRWELTRPSATWIGLVLVQVTLGGLTVLTARNVVVNTAHVGTGALVLATAAVLAWRAYRPLFGTDPDNAPFAR
jgi:heme a synthase